MRPSFRRPPRRAVPRRAPVELAAPPGSEGALALPLRFDLLAGIFEDPVAERLRLLAEALASPGLEEVPERFRALWRALAETFEFAAREPEGAPLQDHLLECLLEDPNPFHRKAERVPFEEIGRSLAAEYGRELDGFLGLVRADWEALARRASGDLPSLSDLSPLGIRSSSPAAEDRRRLKRALLDAPAGAGASREVAAYFLRRGFGVFNRYRVFRWDAREGRLSGVEDPDPVRLSDLVGYDTERKPLVENVRAFAEGKPALPFLVYGDRGTGKSSTVKALAGDFTEQGLRLVEVSPGDLLDYPRLLAALRGRPERFLLFVDDLSFDADDALYRGVKALLEGGVERTPENVLLCATSNRRHLVREFFAERGEPGEVRGGDTVQEKLSLADRFGLTATFAAPDQERYLAVVRHWAAREGVRVSDGELREGALRWAREQNGLSGRTARQYVLHLKGRAAKDPG